MQEARITAADAAALAGQVARLEGSCRRLERQVAFLAAQLSVAALAVDEPRLLAAVLAVALPDELVVHRGE